MVVVVVVEEGVGVASASSGMGGLIWISLGSTLGTTGAGERVGAMVGAERSPAEVASSAEGKTAEG